MARGEQIFPKDRNRRKGVYHTPFIFHKGDRPFIWVTSGDTLRYKGLSYNMDPKWVDYPEMPEEIIKAIPEWMRMDSQK